VDAAGGPPPEFLSTHPNPGNRIADMTRQVRREYPDHETGTYVRNQQGYQSAIVSLRAAQPAYALADQADAIMAQGYQAQNEGNTAQAKLNYEEALGLYRQAASREPEHAILHVNVSKALFYLERHDEAEQSVRRAIQLDGSAFWPNFMGGVVSLVRKDYAVASGRLERALNLIPGSPVGNYYLAVAYDGQNRRDDAVGRYRTVYDMFRGEGELAQRSRERMVALGEPDPAAPRE